MLSSLEFGTGFHPTSSRDSSVHAGRARFGGTARFRASCSLARLVAIVTSDASVAVPARDPGLSAERSFAGPAEDDFFPRRRESRRWFLSPETPSTGADSSAYPLAEVALLRGRLESLRLRRYASSIEDDFFRQRRLVLTLLAKDAREVFPRRLAPAREPLSSAYAT